MKNTPKKLETYTVYTSTETGATKAEIRSAQELTTDEYYEYIEEDRIVPSDTEKA